MSLVVYEDVDIFKFLYEVEQLLPEHYEEISGVKEYPLEPNYEVYKQLANAGMLKSFLCRVDGDLAGYAIFLVHPHLHYKSCKTAFEDVYFVAKKYRKGRLGIKLFKYAEKVLKEEGVKRIFMHTKVHLDNSRLFEYLGYKLIDKVYTKVL